MLGLTLREEFRGKRLKGTAIELSNDQNGPDQATRNAASRATTIYNAWAATQAIKPTQGSLFEEYEL